MNTLANGFSYRPPRRDSHWFFAAIAFLFSAALHVILLYWAQDLRLDASELAEQARSEQEERNRLLPPLRVERMPQDPLRPTFIEQPEMPALTQAAALDMAHVLAPHPDLVSPLPPAPAAQPADTVPQASHNNDHPLAMPLLPRQEVAAIVERRIDDRLAALPRREVAAVERAPQAPDFAPAADLAADRFAGGTGFRPVDVAFGFAEFQAVTLPPPTADKPNLPPPDKMEIAQDMDEAAEVLSERFAEAPEAAQRFIAIDDRLTLALQLYRDPADGGRAYFRLSARPRPDKPLPPLPRDLLLVQDSSASLAEERLYFCRRALTQILEQLGPRDRFNVLAFSDRTQLCFPAWGLADEPHKETARTFIDGLRSRGETDLFASLRRVLDLPRDPERPLVVVIVTDGKATTGLTASTGIIGAFTRLNDGAVSVLGFGTHARANTYLLDMLTYCNRGETRLCRSGRWNIPDALTAFAAGVAQPVMHDIRFAFDTASGSEVYPKQTMNLYADRGLDLYGSCAGNITELVVQLRGRAAGEDYDAVIRLDLENDAYPGDEKLRTRWAWQRMYHLIGLYARDPKPLYLEAMESIQATYGIPIPYASDLGR